MSTALTPGERFRRSLFYTASLANVIDHLETSLYLFLAPVMVRDLLHDSFYKGLFTWSLGLSMGGLLRILLALSWNQFHQRLGSLRILQISLLAVGLTCGLMGVLGCVASSMSTYPLWLPALIFITLRSIQSVFSMAETHAGRSLIMSYPGKSNHVASMWVNASSILGTFLASLLCFVISLWDATLSGWPWIYIGCSLLALILARWRAGLSSSIIVESGQQAPIDYAILLRCVVAAAFGYATFHWISIITATHLEGAAGRYLYSQTQVMGLDCMLLILAGFLSRFTSSRRQVTASALVCTLVCLAYSLGQCNIYVARWTVLVAGVANAACYSSWLVELTQPRFLFPYSCLAGAIGSTLAGFALNANLYAKSEGYHSGFALLPFLAIFFMQLLISLFYKSSRSMPSPPQPMS